MGVYEKDPSAKLAYGFDWITWLGTGVTLVSAVWTIESPLTKLSEAITTTQAAVKISGGVAGVRYKISCHIVDSSGNEDTRSHTICVTER
jgi:hypothetical protein